VAPRTDEGMSVGRATAPAVVAREVIRNWRRDTEF